MESEGDGWLVTDEVGSLDGDGSDAEGIAEGSAGNADRVWLEDAPILKLEVAVALGEGNDVQ